MSPYGTLKTVVGVLLVFGPALAIVAMNLGIDVAALLGV